MAEDTTYTTEVNDKCSCVSKPTKTLRTCCCPDPETHETCDKEKGEKEIVKTRYKLIQDSDGSSCKKIVTRQSKLISSEVTTRRKVGKCGANNVRIDSIYKTSRQGCERKESLDKTEAVVCECSNKEFTVDKCDGDRTLVTTTSRQIKECCQCSGLCQCKSQIISIKSSTVVCPPSSITRSACQNDASRKMLITRVTYDVKNCKCVPQESKDARDCTKCPYTEFSRISGGCDKHTGKEIIKIEYRDIDCKKKTKTEEYSCSCVDCQCSTEKVCENGVSFTKVDNYEFDAKNRICVLKSSKTPNPITCPKDDTVNTPCGQERQYFYKRTFIKYELNKQTCACTYTTEVKYIICAAPPNVTSSWRCERNDHLVRDITTYTIDLQINNFIKRTEKNDEMVICTNIPRSRKVYKNRCEYTLYKYRGVVQNCQCNILETTKTVVLCCVNPPDTKYSCENQNTRVVTITEYKVSTDRRRCEPVVSTYRQKIGCRRYSRTSVSPCVNGGYFVTTRTFAVRNCRCVTVNVSRIPQIILCDSSPRTSQTCEQNIWKITTTVSNIVNCRCVSSSKCVTQTIECDLPVIKTSSCNRRTGKITVDTTSFNVINCKCVPKREVKQIPCPCFRKDIIERTTCVGDKRVVNKLRSEQENGLCRWKVLKTEMEDCFCRNDISNTVCTNNKFLLTTTTIYVRNWVHLNLRVQRCCARTLKKKKPVVCNRGYTYSTPCQDFQQSVISCKYKVTNCVCNKVCQTKCIRACNCNRKNKSERKCINNKLYEIRSSYTDNGEQCGCGCIKTVAQCVKTESKIIIPTPCAPPRNPVVCTPCIFEQNNGYYKKCTITKAVIEDCKYQLKSHTVMKLCSCKCQCISEPICRSNVLILVSTTFHKRGNSCVSNVTETKKPIYCAKPYIIANERENFIEFIRVYEEIENCKCVKKQERKTNPKCNTKIPPEKICSNTFWTYIDHKLIQKYTTYKLFMDMASSPLVSTCEKVSKTTTGKIDCEPRCTVIFCNTKTKQLTITTTYYAVENCKCVRKKNVDIKPCTPCGPPIRNVGNCGPSDSKGFGYRNVEITVFKLTNTNQCKKSLKYQTEICRCPPPGKRTLCEGGKIVHESTTYIITSKPPCKPIIVLQKEDVRCYNFGKENTWKLFKTTNCGYPGQYTMDYYEREEFDNSSCECKRRERSVRRQICCKPCISRQICENNISLIERTCWNPRNLECVKVISKIPLEGPKCHSSIERKIGKHVRCVQKYSLESFVIRNCICVSQISTLTRLVCCLPRTKLQKKCIGKRWEITKTKFNLINGKCIPSPKISYEDICGCDCSTTFKDVKNDECTFWRSYFKKGIENCKCEQKFDRKELLNSCCISPKPIVTCENHKTFVTTTKLFTLVNFRCLPRSERKAKGVDCSSLKLFERESTGKCTVKDTYFEVVYKNCKCERKVVQVENNEICCYHKKPHHKRLCNQRIGLITKISYDFKLQNKKCVQFEKCRESLRVDCDRKDCKTVVGPCIQNTNVVKITCSKRHKCRCIPEVKENRQCCKPESYEWKEVGKCIGYFKEIKYYSFRLDRVINLCKPEVMRVQEKRCACPKQEITDSCENNVITITKTVKYTLNEEKDTCIQTVNTQVRPIPGCSNVRRRVRTISKVCNKKTGWGVKTTEYVQAKNCKCVTTRRVSRYICLCQVAFPRQENTFCRNNKVWVTTIKTATCRRRRYKNPCGCPTIPSRRRKNLLGSRRRRNKDRRVTWKLVEKLTPILNCERFEIQKGNCFPSEDGYATRIRYVSKIQYTLVNCSCVSKEVSKVKEHCECRKTLETVQCQETQIQTTTTFFNIENGFCKPSPKVVITPVPCPSKPKITHTKCILNKYNIITEVFYRQNCKCLSKSSQRECDCKCPETPVQHKCTKRYLMEEITTKWVKENCRCKSCVSSRQYEPPCPSYTKVSTSGCIRDRNSGYQTITTRNEERRNDICKCEIKSSLTYKLCWCNENIETKQYCRSGDNLVTETWKSKINVVTNKCERVMVSSSCKKIPRPKTVILKNCNKLTGIYVKTYINFKVENCKVKSFESKVYKRCNCSDAVQTLPGNCPPSSCKRTDVLVSERLVKHRCIKVEKLQTVTCCCLPKFVVKQYCEGNKFYNSTTENILKNNICVPETKVRELPINCSSAIITKKGKCNQNGDKIIQKYKYVIKDCKCVLEKIKEYNCKCSCSKEKIEYSCNTQARIETKTTTKYSVSKCKCVSNICKNDTPIKCPRDNTVISPCTPVDMKDYSIRTITKTQYEVNSACKCVAKVNVDKEICSCKRNEVVTRSCNKVTNELTITTSYKELRNKECVTRIKNKKICTCCGSGEWALKGDSGCTPNNGFGTRVLTYVKQVMVDCGCKEEVKKKQCHCICEGPPTKSSCEGDQIKHISYSYAMVDCKCVVNERVWYEKIKCPALPPLKVDCHRDIDGVFREYTIHRERKVEQCKCQTLERREGCVCRCNPSTTIKKCEGKMFIHIRTWFTKTCKQCIAQTEKRCEPIPCGPALDCRVIKTCTGRAFDKQTHECTRKTLNNCNCDVRKEILNSECWCRPPRVHKGPCNMRTCKRDITTSIFNLVLGRNLRRNCVRVTSVNQQICCCLKKPKQTQECKDNKFYKTNEEYVFDEATKSCPKKVTTVTVPVPCLPAEDKVAGPCNRITLKQQILITRKSLVQCVCKVTSEIYSIYCDCPKNTVTKKCRPDNRFLTTELRFTLKDGKCLENKCENIGPVIQCPKKTSEYISECNPMTRMRKKRILSYRIHNCSCIQIVEIKDEICRCPYPSMTEICVRESGDIKRITRTYVLDSINHECIMDKDTKITKTCCCTEIKTNCGDCVVSHNCGTYKKCTTTTSERIGCQCVFKSKNHFQLCYCQKPTTEEICHQNNIMRTIETFYKQTNKNDANYKYQCEKKTRKISEKKIFGKESFVTSDACVNNIQIYTKTYYEVIKCTSVLKTKTYKIICGCPCEKEIKRTCVGGKREEVTIQHYKLECNGKRIPNCKCVQDNKVQTKEVKCRKSSSKKGECIDGKRTITYTEYKPENCKCIRSEKVKVDTCE